MLYFTPVTPTSCLVAGYSACIYCVKVAILTVHYILSQYRSLPGLCSALQLCMGVVVDLESVNVASHCFVSGYACVLFVCSYV